MYLYPNQTVRNIEGKLKMEMRLSPNPSFKVFFRAISRIKQARKLIFEGPTPTEWGPP